MRCIQCTALSLFLWLCSPARAMASSFTRFLRTTVGRLLWTSDQLVADLYLTTHNTHNRQTSMPPRGIRTHDLSRRTAADLRLRQHDHWDRPGYTVVQILQGIVTKLSIFTVMEYAKPDSTV
jgi:hypothetical protein